MDTTETQATTVQVAMKWGEHPLEVRFFNAPCCLQLGDAPTRLKEVHVRDLREGTAPILDFQAHGRLMCNDTTVGTVQLGNETKSLRQLGKSIDGTEEIEVDLPRGARLEVCVGTLTYVVTFHGRERFPGLRRGFSASRAATAGLLATTAVHAGAVALLALLSPPLGLGPGEVTDEQVQLMRRYLNASAEREAEAKESSATSEYNAREGGTGTRARGEEGGMGEAYAPTQRYGVAPPHASFGMLGVLNAGEGGGLEIGLGHGAGTGSGQGFGSGHGRLGGSHRTRPPTLHSPSAGFAVGHGGAAPASVKAPAATETRPTEDTPIDPNGRFATTYRPGGGHLSAFEAAVSRGVIPVAHRALVASIGSGHAPDVPLVHDRAMAFLPSLERSQLSPSGGAFHLRFAMRSSPNAPDSRPRLSVHLVLDTSGSMQGEPIAHARDAARAVVDQLHPTDDFSLVTFASEGHVRVEDGPVGPRRAAIHGVISTLCADGGTNLGEGLHMAYAQASKRTIPEDAVRVVLVVSDGRANEGIIGSSQLARKAIDAFQVGIQTSTFGVGVDYDGPLMSRIASDGAGGYYYLPSSDQIASALTSELDKRLRPVATALEIRIRLRPGVELLHVYGSGLLSESESSRVRATEVAADRHAEKRDGIKANRQDDLEGGMRFFVPAFASDERHALLLKLRVPAGVGERKVGVIEVRYKDRLAKQNRSEEFPVMAAYANSDAASAQSIDRSVTRTIQGYMAGESLLAASRFVAEGRHDQALAILSEREIILRRAAAEYGDAAFVDDAARLTRIRTQLDPRAEPLALAMLLEAAGRSAL